MVVLKNESHQCYNRHYVIELCNWNDVTSRDSIEEKIRANQVKSNASQKDERIPVAPIRLALSLLYIFETRMTLGKVSDALPIRIYHEVSGTEFRSKGT